MGLGFYPILEFSCRIPDLPAELRITRTTAHAAPVGECGDAVAGPLGDLFGGEKVVEHLISRWNRYGVV